MSWAIEAKGYSQRRVGDLIGIAPKTYRYASSRPDDAALCERLKTFANERRRHRQSQEAVLLYREERLTVNRRGG